MRASRMREFTGDAEEDASCEASGVNDLDHKTTPPSQNKRNFHLSMSFCIPLWEIEQWSSILWITDLKVSLQEIGERRRQTFCTATHNSSSRPITHFPSDGVPAFWSPPWPSWPCFTYTALRLQYRQSITCRITSWLNLSKITNDHLKLDSRQLELVPEPSTLGNISKPRRPRVRGTRWHLISSQNTYIRWESAFLEFVFPSWHALLSSRVLSIGTLTSTSNATDVYSMSVLIQP